MALTLGTDWEQVAAAIIDKFPVNFSHIELDKVLFLSEDEKTPKKYADTRIVPYPFGFLVEYKYVITFYENNIQSMTDAQKHMLVFHELLHIDESFEKIRRHNIEEFRELISVWGINWDIDPNLPDILTEEVNSSDFEDNV